MDADARERLLKLAQGGLVLPREASVDLLLSLRECEARIAALEGALREIALGNPPDDVEPDCCPLCDAHLAARALLAAVDGGAA